MITKRWTSKRWLASLGVAALLLQAVGPAAEPTADMAVFGGNLLDNAEFEAWADGTPEAWIVSVNDAAAVRVAPEETGALTGRAAIRLAVEDGGSVGLASAPVPVEPGVAYLFSVAYRSAGFGAPGHYSGVSASARLVWRDEQGKQVGAETIPRFPYHAVDKWDLRDGFVTAPDGAATVTVEFSMGNNSVRQTGAAISSILWLDAARLTRYNPPVDPPEAGRPVDRGVEGGMEMALVTSYNLSGMGRRYDRSEIVSDAEATDGTRLQALTGLGAGIFAHSATMTSPRPGIYRAVLRAKSSRGGGGEPLGRLDISSELAGGRAALDIGTDDFDEPGVYRDIAFDFIYRTPGWWLFRLHTTGEIEWSVDTLRVYPVRYFDDREFLAVFSGSEGQIPESLVPGRKADDRSGTALVVAGPLHQRWRVADALHLAGTGIAPVHVAGRRSQTFPGFPATAEELFTHRLIVLCGIEVQSLTIAQRHLLSEFVRRGGGLALLGGHRAYDRGGIQHSLLAAALPVVFPAPDTPHPALGGSGRPSLLKAEDADHPLLADYDLADAPVAYWWHRAEPKPEATVLLSLADGEPAMVAGTFGAGRVLCVLTTCHGNPQPGQTPFWDWSPWPMLLRDLMWWTTGTEDRRWQ